MVTPNFVIETPGNLEDLKEKKIKILKESAKEIIESEYPVYKQLNNRNSDQMRLYIDRVRSIVSKVEKQIIESETLESVFAINVEKENLVRLLK